MANNQRPAFGRDVLPYEIRDLESAGFPPPPYGLKGGKLGLFNWTCKKYRCKGRALFSFEICGTHWTITTKGVQAMYARWAKVVLESGALYFTELLKDLENRSDGWTDVDYVRYAPRVIAMLDVIEGSRSSFAFDLPWLKGVSRKYAGNVDYRNAMVNCGVELWEWYDAALKRRSVENGVIIGQMEELVAWAVDYCEVYSA